MLGNCCIFDSQSKKYNSLQIKRISIKGIQRNLVAKFEVEQVFESNEEETKEVCYLFPNDFKYCIYDTTFMIGSEIIKPKIQPSQQARWIYKESIKRGYPVIMGTNLPEGLTLFKFGNLPTNTECKVLLKIAFLCQLATPLSMFLKFPLKMYTPDGSKNWFHTPNLSFKLNCDNTQISDASCNLPFTYLQDECSIVLKENFRNDHELNDNNSNNGASAIFTINLKNKFENFAYSNGHDCLLMISPKCENLKSNERNNEFIFIIDCSYSMKGQSILEARECLEIFIRSLPPNSFFNIIRFGSKYESLFPTSVKYTEKTCTMALKFAKEMKADLGNTNLFNPLKDAFEKEPKSPFQRQFFILTDGIISHCEPIFNLVSENKIKNRCFTVGIGKNADLCLVEGVAHLSFGKNIFVSPNESLADKVIPLLQDSLNTNSILPDIHVEGNDNFEISPFPIPNIVPNDCYKLFFHSETSEIRNSILFSAHFDKKCEILVPILEGEENSFHDIKDVIYPLFCFHLLQKYEMRNHLNRSDMEKAVSLSISSGIVCKYTAFIGVSTKRRLKSNKKMYFWLKRKGNNEEYEEYVDASMQICRLFADNIVNIYQRNLFDDIKLGASLDIDEEIKRIENLDNEIGDSLPIHDKESCQPEINKFMSLIQLQTFGGFWQDLETVNRLTEVNIHSLGDLKLEKSLELKIIQSINNKKESDSILCTFLVIAIFRKMWSERKDAWMMIENKAINWLKDQLPLVEIESVIQNIESLLSSNP